MNKSKIKKSRPPFGFTWQDSELTHVKDEVPIYVELFELYLIHQRKTTVARILNERGYRTRASKKFTFSAVDRLLKNPIAKGIYAYSVCEAGTGVNKQAKMLVPSIVSEDTWNQVQDIMSSQAGTKTRSPSQDLFVGKVYCECDEPMVILSKSTKYSCHKCNTEVPIEDIHAIFEKSIEDIPFPDRIILDKLTANRNPNTEPAIKSNIARLEIEIEKLFELHSSDAISVEVFKDRHQKLNTQLNELKTNLASLDNNPPQSYSTLLDYWQSIDPKTKLLITDVILHNITLKKNVAAISLYPLFNFAQQAHTRGM